ncbi:MAG: molybdate transport system substrate-binding protein [Actinomycetota bacterium]|nr:molybdate transport system substrate-binding protein [Actinomycetota bacterium]
MKPALRRGLVIAICLVLGACSSPSGSSASGDGKSGPPSNVTVFAASSLTQGFSKLGSLFEKQHKGAKVRFNFSASDTLANQITQGAPADVFAAAGAAPMQTVTSASLASGKPQVFASNRLLIITPKADPAGIRHPQDLARAGVKLVLAAPGVPAGDYARQMLGNLGIRKQAEKNIVSNEIDDKSVVSKVLLGDADAGIVYVSDLTPDVASRLVTVHVPSAENVVARYPIVALRNGSVSGRQFVQLVLSSTGQRILRDFGFGPP